MKVCLSSQLPVAKIGSSDVLGKELVSWSDGVSFATYDVVLEAGSTTTLTSCFGEEYNHVYYCLYGDAEANVPQQHKVAMFKDTAVALGAKMEMSLKARVETRLMVTYVKEEEPRGKAVVKNMSDITGTDKDVNWGRGRSRRLLTKYDGFNLSLHNTICDPHRVSPLAYYNNYELAFYVRGDVTYTWHDGKESYNFQQDRAEDGDGCVFLMDKNDPHELQTADMQCECACIFYPALKGTENHDFSGGNSSY